MHATQILKRPVITEKSAWEAGDRNRYSFEVDIRANKTEIRDAVAAVYKVRVQRVSTQIRKGEEFRNKYGASKKPNWKRATVELHPDDRIELF